MALKIEDLPSLPDETDSLDPNSDLLVVQKVNGASYKITCSDFVASSVSPTRYIDSKTFFINQAYNSGHFVSFSSEGLFNLNSSFFIDIFAAGMCVRHYKNTDSYSLVGLSEEASFSLSDYEIISTNDYSLSADISSDSENHIITYNNLRYSINDSGLNGDFYSIIAAQPITFSISANIVN
jgi:hypothetical protein